MNAVELYINRLEAERMEKERVEYQLHNGDLRGITPKQVLNYMQDSIREAIEPYIGRPVNSSLVSIIIEDRLRNIQMMSGMDYRHNVELQPGGSIEVSIDIKPPSDLRWLRSQIVAGLGIPSEYFEQ